MTHPLSKYFTLEEMVISQEAIRRGIDNSPTTGIIAALTYTALEMDKVREFLNNPIIVSSGYRSPQLNAVLGGSPTSSHMSGEAVDFICPGFGNVRETFNAIIKSPLQFDQCIVEFGRWIHMGFGVKNRRECLVYNGNGYREIV